MTTKKQQSLEAPELSKLPCCPACLEDGPSEYILSKNGCCCFHTEPRPLPESWKLPEGWTE